MSSFLVPEPDRIKPTRDEIAEVRRRLEYECHPGTEEWSRTCDELLQMEADRADALARAGNW